MEPARTRRWPAQQWLCYACRYAGGRVWQAWLLLCPASPDLLRPSTGPVGLLHYDNLERARDVARDQSMLTHSHIKCQVCAGVVGVGGAVGRFANMYSH